MTITLNPAYGTGRTSVSGQAASVNAQVDEAGNVVGLTLPSGATELLPDTLTLDGLPRIIFGGASAIYSQSLTTVTVTQVAHGLTAVHNGASIYLTQSTGLLVTGWFTNFTYVSADAFTCTCPISHTASGNLGTNTAATDFTSEAVPAGLIGSNGRVEVAYSVGQKGSSDAHTYTVKMGALTLDSNVLTTEVFSNFTASCQNKNNAAKQVVTEGPADTLPVQGTVNTAAATTVKISVTLAAATDYAILWGHRTTIYPQ